jgi:hypothetical protein
VEEGVQVYHGLKVSGVEMIKSEGRRMMVMVKRVFERRSSSILGPFGTFGPRRHDLEFMTKVCVFVGGC